MCAASTPCLDASGQCTQKCVPLAAAWCQGLCPNALQYVPSNNPTAAATTQNLQVLYPSVSFMFPPNAAFRAPAALIHFSPRQFLVFAQGVSRRMKHACTIKGRNRHDARTMSLRMHMHCCPAVMDCTTRAPLKAAKA